MTQPVAPMGKNRIGMVPSKAERERWSLIAALGCIICGRQAQIHHAGTGMGGRKDHSKVLGLCFNHHQGKEGIHTLGRRVWQQRFGTETELLQETERMLDGQD